MALLLRNKGVKRIRPLQGGLDAWRELGYPLQTVEVNTGDGDPSGGLTAGGFPAKNV